MPTIPPKDDDDDASRDKDGTTRAANGQPEGDQTLAIGTSDIGVEGAETAAERRDADDTIAADWWLGQPPDELRELAEDFERLRGLQKIFGFRACGVLRKKLARKVERLFKLTKVCVCDVD